MKCFIIFILPTIITIQQYIMRHNGTYITIALSKQNSTTV
ncbi:hypothetical protein Patl1_05488 [Pistacia atlantica]|uniref:Uncharacterized protein n=1 Tax=Pistacia atlantica TaxID=434234 RepID=A0ACC1BQX9_9ROSI|nr:hypothetical protein Patl1_05488 [Pistacia atlantica]